MKQRTSLKKLTTICGEEFEKNRLEVLLFQPLSFSQSNSAYTFYRTPETEYLKCRHHYDALTDIITMTCEYLSG
jgi:cell fate regulator YaaT (PSP1 superfamily)